MTGDGGALRWGEEVGAAKRCDVRGDDAAIDDMGTVFFKEARRCKNDECWKRLLLRRRRRLLGNHDHDHVVANKQYRDGYQTIAETE